MFDPVHAVIRSAAEEAGLIPKRVDDLTTGEAILQNILHGIEECSVIVADLTGQNANVFYELGIAHTRKEHVVMLAQDINDVPFDLRPFGIIAYKDSPGGLSALSTKLRRTLSGLAGQSVGTDADESVRVLYWSGGRDPAGSGLIVENIGDDVALDLEGQRVLPDGRFEICRALRSLRPGERQGIDQPWEEALIATDPPPIAAPPGKYATRVIWVDRSRMRHFGPWTPVDKRP